MKVDEHGRKTASLEELLDKFSAAVDAITDSGNYELLESHVKKAGEALEAFGIELSRVKKSLTGHQQF